MADSTPPREPSPPGRFPWRTLFHRSSSALFVIGGNRRLRYANPAWEQATGVTFGSVRGARLPARKSTDSLAGTLAPPPEAWAGQVASVRRPAPAAALGPPWWDITFMPLLAAGASTPVAILGRLTIVAGPPDERAAIPAAAATELATLAGRFSFAAIDGHSSWSRRLASQVRATASASDPVWIIGEPGSGKETAARIIHHNSARKERSFVAIDCTGLQPYLIEGTLFGKGGLAASRRVGTLLLKMPESLPRDLQTRIVSWCEKTGGPRLISSSERPAAAAVEAGTLLSCFDERLSAIELRLPPLRDRLDDLPQLVPAILAGMSAPASQPNLPEDHGLTMCEADLSIYPILREHDWPGNFRELMSVLAAASTASSGGLLLPEHLPRYVRERHLIASDPRPAARPLQLDAVLEAVERRLILMALARAKGNQTEAAASLGIFRTRLGRRIEALKLDEES